MVYKTWVLFLTCDDFINVPDEIGLLLLESERLERNYINRLIYHKAYYSLDRDDGIEHSAVDKPLTPEEMILAKWDKAQLYAAIATLPDKQAKRIYAHFFMGMSKSAIAKAEGVNVNAVCESIVRGIAALRKFF